MKATVVATLEEFEAAAEAEQRGVVFFATTAVFLLCPGCGKGSALPIDGVSKPRWRMLVREPPTLVPSIWHDKGCGWHGFLTDGEFTNV